MKIETIISTANGRIGDAHYREFQVIHIKKDDSLVELSPEYLTREEALLAQEAIDWALHRLTAAEII